MSVYRTLLRPLLFTLDAEHAHDLTLSGLSSPAGAWAAARTAGRSESPALRQRMCGLDFPNPLGLAAGLDKQGTAGLAWQALGFGFAEIGTVTPRPQPGNPRPRLFRLPNDRAIINRFGFNSDGAAAVAAHLARARRSRIRVGINIGKNKDTPNDRAIDDYLRAVEVLHAQADYFAVNVSSPNTTGLRDLQEARVLRALIEQVVARVRAVSPRPIPVIVKVAPDLAPADLLASVDAAVEGGAAGVIATNTTIARPGLASPAALTCEPGGLSGAPLKAMANDACRRLFAHFKGRVPIVGVGGISNGDDAYERIRSGASLIQIYTALIYEGPGVVAEILNTISSRLQRDGFTHLHEAIGADVQ